ncbi:MAG: tetratricopeptide repeat protein [Chlorobi bacterium]|nr:tetratricopeptide repeat protein [Chlorobiota bacterium]
MKKFAFIILMTAGLFGCSGNAGRQQKITEKKEDVKTEKKKPAAEVSVNNNFLSNTRTVVDMATAKAAYNKGVELYKSGKLDEALEQFNIVLKNNANNSLALHYLGRISYDKGNKKQAIKYYEDAARNNINDSVSVLGIGQIYFEMGDKKNAMDYYNIALDIAPHYGLAYYNRGTLYGMENQYEKALEDLNKSIQYDSTNGNAYINRGLAHYYLKNLDLACRDWQKAADMGFKQGKDAVEMYCKRKK